MINDHIWVKCLGVHIPLASVFDRKVEQEQRDGMIKEIRERGLKIEMDG